MQKPRESKAEDMEEPTRVYFLLSFRLVGFRLLCLVCLLAIAVVCRRFRFTFSHFSL